MDKPTLPPRPDLLGAVLDMLFPGTEDGWPAAGTLDLAEAVLADATAVGAEARLMRFLSALPADFLALDRESKLAVLEELETSDPDAFGAALHHGSCLYYTDQRVLDVVEQKTGYPARPPLYEGYEMTSFDDASLDQQRKRDPFWRKA